MPHFVQDVEEIRRRAIQKIDDGPVTEAYGLDKDRAIDILNEALATEIVCVLRYMHHYFMATGVHGKSVAGEFKEHADAEREHADDLAERISQLGGKPDFNPRNLLERSVSQYVEGETLADMIREDLIAERIVIEVYTDMIRFFGNNDPTTRVMLEKILKDEEEHADDLADLLYIVDPHTGETEGEDPGTRPLQMHSEERGRGGRQGQRDDGGGRSQQQAQRPQQQQAQRSQQQAGSEQQSRSRSAEAAGTRTEARGQRTGITNREATESLERGDLSKQAERGRESRSADTTRNVQKSEMRPARATQQQRPASGRGAEIAPAHEPGTRGRPTRKGTDEVYAEAGDVHEGEESGTARAVRVTNPNRKRKRVA